MAISPEEHTSIAPIVGPDDPRRFTDSGIEVKPLYTSEDLPPDLDERLGEPGDYPYTRGVHREMYRKQLWTMRQYAGYATAKESNERYRYLLAHGGTRLSIALDPPTQLGLDSHRPRRRDRPVHGLRPADAAGSRLRRPALPGRGRPDRRRHRHDRRHAHGVRPDPARRGLDVDDDQRAGQRAAVPLPDRRRGAGRRVPEAAGHDAERHPQGVHRPRELHLPARGLDAPHHGPLRLLQGERPEVEH